MPVVEGVLRVIGEGRPLEPAIRKTMERFFHADFSSVRVHEGVTARSIGALAFTLGDEIHFAPGLYDPDSREGMALLGHELAHVVQQREGRVENPYGQGIVIVQDPALEAEAEQMGQRVADELWSGAWSGQARQAGTRRDGAAVMPKVAMLAAEKDDPKDFKLPAAGPPAGDKKLVAPAPALPILIIDRKQTPTAALLFDAYLESLPAHHKPVTLTYDPDKGRAEVRRYQAQTRGLTINAGYGKVETFFDEAAKSLRVQAVEECSIDEFPYACTYEGGIDSVVAPIPTEEQQKQGGFLGSFIVKHQLKDGSRFIVKAIGK